MFAKHGWMLAAGDDYRTNANMWEGQRVALVDVARSGKVKYDILEALKGGTMINSKYQCGARSYREPHVVVFANYEPDVTQLTADRWNLIRELGDRMTLTDFFPESKFPAVSGLLVGDRDPFVEARAEQEQRPGPLAIVDAEADAGPLAIMDAEANFRGKKRKASRSPQRDEEPEPELDGEREGDDPFGCASKGFDAP